MKQTYSYEAYLEEAGVITFEECGKIYERMINAAPESDPEFDKLFENMLERAVIYAGYRQKWFSMNLRERLAMDEERSRNHDLFIRAKNDLAKYMYSKKLDIVWDDMLGEERKRIGDFGCYLTFLRSLQAR